MPRTKVDVSLGNLPPQALDVEKRVLGALLIDANAFYSVNDILCSEAFYDPKNKVIYEAIVDLNNNGDPIDLFTVIEQLKKYPSYKGEETNSYVNDILFSTTSSVNVEHHAQILKQKYASRQVIEYANGLLKKAYDESLDISEVMEYAEQNLYDISSGNVKQDYSLIGDVLNEAEELITKASSSSDGITGVPSGYHELDDITSGWQASDLIILAGRPAMGKTSFALSLARNIAIDNGIPVAFFSLEMSKVQLVNRLISNVCEIYGRKIMNGMFDEYDWKRYDSRVNYIRNSQIFIDDTPSLSVMDLRSKARKLVLDKGAKIIFVDYLQLMTANGSRFNSRQEEVSIISRSLKTIAKELNVPIIALSQLSRSVEQRPGSDGKVPQLSDLRESGAIEQDADMVLFVHRPEYYRIYQDADGNDLKGVAQIVIAKHRKGGMGTVNLRFRGEFTRFDNPEDAPYIENHVPF